MMLHENFEWDEEKALTNFRKHGMSFDEAAYILMDDQAEIFHLEEYDYEHSATEHRQITTGSAPEDRTKIFVITWTDRSTADAQVTRIISARPAERRERQEYVKEISERQNRS